MACGFGTANDGSFATSMCEEPTRRKTVATTPSAAAAATSHRCQGRVKRPVGISTSRAITAGVLATKTPSATALRTALPDPLSTASIAAAARTQAAKIRTPATHRALAAP